MADRYQDRPYSADDDYDRGGDPHGIETFVGLMPGLGHNAVHELFGYRTALTLSRGIVG